MSHEAFLFQMANTPENATVNWYVDGKPAATTTAAYLSVAPFKGAASRHGQGMDEPVLESPY
jgi:beta-glucanase (GH16 family)